jgi:hypothetical protein
VIAERCFWRALQPWWFRCAPPWRSLHPVLARAVRGPRPVPALEVPRLHLVPARDQLGHRRLTTARGCRRHGLRGDRRRPAAGPPLAGCPATGAGMASAGSG